MLRQEELTEELRHWMMRKAVEERVDEKDYGPGSARVVVDRAGVDKREGWTWRKTYSPPSELVCLEKRVRLN